MTLTCEVLRNQASAKLEITHLADEAYLMTERYFLDTNALLNAVFISESWSRRLVNSAGKANTQFVTGVRTLDEARSVLRETVKRTGSRGGLMHYVMHYIEAKKFHILPPASPVRIPQIQAHDQHVVDEAVLSGSWVITSDAALLRGCAGNQIAAMSLLDALRRIEGLSIDKTWYGVPPQKDAGLVFCRATAAGWALPHVRGKFTLFHAPPWLWIYYDKDRNSWRAEVENAVGLEIFAPIEIDQTVAVAVSWKANERWIMRCSGTSTTASRHLGSRWRSHISQTFTMGHTLDSLNFWNGPINVCIMDDRPISRRLWKHASSLDVGVYPNPFDSDRLNARLFTELRAGGLFPRLDS